MRFLFYRFPRMLRGITGWIPIRNYRNRFNILWYIHDFTKTGHFLRYMRHVFVVYPTLQLAPQHHRLFVRLSPGSCSFISLVKLLTCESKIGTGKLRTWIRLLYRKIKLDFWMCRMFTLRPLSASWVYVNRQTPWYMDNAHSTVQNIPW